MKQTNVGLTTIKRMMILLQVWQYIQIKLQKKHTFLIHLDISKAPEKYKKPQDLILPFKYIYKKEYLRKWIENNFDWRDWLFDEIYDAWYNKQTVIIDK